MTRRFVALLAVVLLAGCGTTEIDSDAAESFIEDSVTEQTGARVKSVECPEGLTAKAGETFECTVTGEDNTRGRVLVTEKDDEGNVNVSAPFVHVRDVEDRIADGLRKQIGGAVTLTCPEIVEGAKGVTYECEASGDADVATVLVTQTTDDGDVRYEVQQ